MAHAVSLAELIGDPGPGRCVDLGTGAGLPGLVLARHWQASTWTLLDQRERSEAFVSWAAAALDLGERVVFHREDAAAAARQAELAGGFDLAVARAFGSPSLTAECATGFLRLGGRLVVSEPAHADARRWPSTPLATLGLAVVRRAGPPWFVELHKVSPHGSVYPRRSAAMRRKPLY